MAERKYRAHSESAPGDFYVLDQECITCGMPHVVAPELMAWTEKGDHCFWRRQPETPLEVEKAVQVILTSDVGCHRYSGDDPKIIKKVGREFCDAVDPKQK